MSAPLVSQNQPRFFGLVRPRLCLVPTWRGWAILGCVGLFLGFLVFSRLYPFLAQYQSIPGGILVVEGWAPDEALKTAAEEFGRGNYQRLYVTGGPLEHGAPLSEYKTYAERGSATLLKLGLSTNMVQAIPATLVRLDRTYTSALVLQRWLNEHNALPEKLNLVTVGAHARRSRLLFAKAFPKPVLVGVIAVPEEDFEPEHWWRTSAGVRTVLGEVFAYGYVSLFFRPHSLPE